MFVTVKINLNQEKQYENSIKYDIRLMIDRNILQQDKDVSEKKNQNIGIGFPI